METFLYYAASLCAVILVLVPHEFAHAFVAYKCGDGTAKAMGRLTLNPVKHIDPAGFFLCIIAGFGWAKPVPINPFNFKKYRRGLFLTAIAGVVTNYIIAFIVYPLYLVVSIYAVSSLHWLFYFLRYLFNLTFIYSLSIFVFNLLPFYPLDGFRVIESCTREVNPVRKFLKDYGSYILIILVLESFLCDMLIRYTTFPYVEYFDILGYVQYFARKIIGYPITALWNLIIL